MWERIKGLDGPVPAFEHAFAASVIPPIARISGITDWLEVAEKSGEIVLSSPTVTPLVAMRVKSGLAWLAVLRRDAVAAAERYAAQELGIKNLVEKAFGP